MRFWLLVVVCACGGSARETTFGGDRPVELQVPADTSAPLPLLMVLHAYATTAAEQVKYFKIGGVVADDEAFLIAPNGKTDSTGAQFWNADPVCCDVDHTGVDDSAYLGKVLDDVLAAWPEIDPARVFVLGHSNGGFMAYRLACDRADVISAIGVLAGEAPTAPCAPSQPVDLLAIHGDADATAPYASEMTSLAQWADYDHCATTRTAVGMLDLDASLPGAETTDFREDGCAAMEFWSIAGGTHVPTWSDAFVPTLWAWFGAHHR